MKVLLFNVGRNLNRAYRTCFSFGINELYLIGKSDDKSIIWEKRGNLYSAKDRVKIKYYDSLDNLNMDNTVAFENYYTNSIFNLDWNGIDSILIGGESTGLPRKLNVKEKVCILTVNKFCLTVEASLAIILYEWSRYVNRM